MDERKAISEEQLERVTGGIGDGNHNVLCPHCGENDYTTRYICYFMDECTCNVCGTVFQLDSEGKTKIIKLPETYDDPEGAILNMARQMHELAKKLGK